MKKILLSGACAVALSALAAAPSFARDYNKSGTMNNEKHQTTGSSMKRDDPTQSATTGSSTDAKRGVPGNNAVGGDGSMSNPKSNAPGAAKAGGG